ncbi:LemA family protein [Candidatus Gracilibacteria bacterium]|nr:LemA family protein [Candidatus Gracilibacteria bacterium]MCF7897093.1 LemA family protein [Candidatus Gracilibacteria bacterium]
MNKKLLSPLLILGIIAAVITIWAVSSYNSLISLDENGNNAFAKIETQYQRRLDLIPNVVRTVEGVADFEQETLQNVVAARSAWAAAGTPNGKIAAANNFESALSRLLVTVEAYPELKATEAFRDLITELEGTENRVAFARNEFNDAATNYNKATRTFPRSLIANLFDFEAEKELFKAAAEAKVVPVVDFGDNQ